MHEDRHFAGELLHELLAVHCLRSLLHETTYRDKLSKTPGRTTASCKTHSAKPRASERAVRELKLLVRTTIQRIVDANSYATPTPQQEKHPHAALGKVRWCL